MDAQPDAADDLPEHLLRWLEAGQRRVAHDLDAVLDEAVREVPQRRLRILQLIPDHGIRQKDLAERALVSKQAIAELLDALELDGLVERTPDPSDGRAWLIRRSSHGEKVSELLDDAMLVVEAGLADRVGAARFASFKDVLRELGAEQI